ncbi:adenylate/guanylate cyclase domain-containing protein [Reichenbachiella sp.]|uniref:adenylate/guanylate cyclase domain-containing protein n=1 Tax=Reichenbachiella sp. TaxID=2184521 RepID=UPI00329820C6
MMNHNSSIIKIMWITAGWIVVSILNFFLGYSSLLEYNCDLEGKSVLLPFMGSIYTGIMAGLTGGSIMVLVWEKWLRSKPYGQALLYILATYSIVFVFVSIQAGLFHHVNILDLPITSPKVWTATFDLLLDPISIAPYFFWLLIVCLTLIFLQVNDKFGPGIFKEFLLGKYFQPKREERIFMFLDLRSSTSIAEKLGEEKYFNFLKQVYSWVTPAILNHAGEIYQYVGDEIVISWKPKYGFLRANCLECFFDIQKSLKAKKGYFIEKYGVNPEFKAGLHYGHVMAGEIGVVKRDIAFSGDVLNTTSRIQEQCNPLGVDLLVSKLLSDKLGSIDQKYHLKEIGAMHLKGKAEEVTLFTV